MRDLFNLEGKSAIVTGASRGLGAAIAEGLAASGVNLLLTGRHLDGLEDERQRLKKYDSDVVTVRCDMAKPRQIEAAVRKGLKEFGTIDILVNNAGTIFRAPAEEYPMEEWKNVIDVNMTGLFLMAQETGRAMLEQGHGKIINIASLLSFTGGRTVPAYTASKHGVAGITKALSNEWASRGINVNAIAPGYFETDATAALRKDRKRFRELTGRIPSGTWGKPEDLQGAVIFLASAASDYVHGHILVVDGGWSAA